MALDIAGNVAVREPISRTSRRVAAGPFRVSTLVHGGMMAPIACGEKPLGIGRLWVAITNGESCLARLVRIFLPRRRVLRNPLGRVVLRNKALDNFRFAIGP